MTENKEKDLTFVLFGGTGDLTRRKLLSAFSNLIQKGLISKKSTLIEVSRRDYTDNDYIDFLTKESDERNIKTLKKLNIRYVKENFADKSNFSNLKKVLSECELKECNRIYYLATSFKFFSNIVQGLKKSNLHKKDKGFTRIVFEKPFGNDLLSSNKLDKEIKNAFSENNIYRIDHYLGKETVQNINILKFTNPINYSILSNNYIYSIEVIADEDLGVRDRIEYYNESGAIKDMIQNHLLQVLSLVLMEKPSSLTDEQIQKKKLEALQSLSVLSPENNLLGQYESYASELNKANLEDKKTETFANIVLESKLKRWSGTKLILRTGKKLEKKYSQIKINLKPDIDLRNRLKHIGANQIIINIDPVQDINIFMNTFNPTKEKEIEKVCFEFCRDCKFGPNTKEAYAVLLEEIIKGNKTLFPTADEVRISWEIVEKIMKMKDKIKFIKYKEGSDPESLA